MTFVLILHQQKHWVVTKIGKNKLTLQSLFKAMGNSAGKA